MTRRSFAKLQPSRAAAAKNSEITPPWLLIRIVRDFVDRRSQIVACQVYDPDLDCFHDISPADLGIDNFR
jgi:hypothetical protein